MTALTAIRDYLRWIRRWHVDYTADNWREQNEQRWDAFCRWRAGELPEDIEAAVMVTQIAQLSNDILEAFGSFADALSQTIEDIVPAVNRLAAELGTALSADSAKGGDRE